MRHSSAELSRRQLRAWPVLVHPGDMWDCRKRVHHGGLFRAGGFSIGGNRVFLHERARCGSGGPFCAIACDIISSEAVCGWFSTPAWLWRLCEAAVAHPGNFS